MSFGEKIDVQLPYIYRVQASYECDKAGETSVLVITDSYLTRALELVQNTFECTLT